jgi:hypothetical protein
MDELSRERLAEGRRMLADICAEAAALHQAVRAETDRGQFDGPATQASHGWDEAPGCQPSTTTRSCSEF